MIRHAPYAADKVAIVERIRDRVKLAMHRASESDIDVANDRIDLRIRAAVELILDEVLDDQRVWLRQAEELDAKNEREQAEARR